MMQDSHSHIRWVSCGSWAVYDEAEMTIGHYPSYDEAEKAFEEYCRENFPELYDE